MEWPKLTLDHDGPLATITLCDPPSLNAVGDAMRQSLVQAMNAVLDDSKVRAILITGEGRAFCTGTNLKEIFAAQSVGQAPDISWMLRGGINDMLGRMRTCPKPIVAAVNGPAAGFGCGLALAADIVLVARSAYFLQSFINLGVVPDGGSSWIIPRLAGLGRAAAMMMLGEKIEAEEAVRWGLAYRLFEDAELQGAARALAGALANGPTLAYGQIKLMIESSLRCGFAEQLEREATCQEAAFATDDCREGVAAFIEKRSPRFKGA